ncbi:MAG TPA: hypothetical protein VMI06_03150 [Terriglobia bacterium]|nr:hypothetical protein [Terriglobia bacterium]
MSRRGYPTADGNGKIYDYARRNAEADLAAGFCCWVTAYGPIKLIGKAHAQVGSGVRGRE